MHLRTFPSALVLLALIAAAPSARAQLRSRPQPVSPKPEPTAHKPSTSSEKRSASSPSPLVAEELLRDELAQSDREKLHPGGALEIVGREQAGNEFRARTPALVNAEREVVYVDTEELRARKLAMYAEGRAYHAPLARAVVNEDGVAERAPSSAPSATEPAPQSRSYKWLWLVAGATAAALATFAPRISLKLPARKAATGA